MIKDEFKLEIAKTDYYGKQFGRASVPLEKLEEIEKVHGKEALKTALYELYTQVIEL